MDALEVLYDHYKETFRLVKESQSRRNKSFLLLCILEAILFLALVMPQTVFEIMRNGISEKLNMTLEISNSIFQTLLWLLIVYIMVRYIQDMLYVERQYIYLSLLEKEISNNLSINVFVREGDNYLKDYPMVLNLIDLFYKTFMPIFFIVVNTVRVIEEWMAIKKISLMVISDTILYMAVLIITWFYFFEIHSKITNFCKTHLPFVNKIACVLKNVLKEV